MLEIRDPAIKLFGKTIPVAGDGDESNNSSNSEQQEHDIEKELAEDESMEADQPDDHLSLEAMEESINPQTPETNEDQKTPDSESQKDEEEPNDAKNSQQKPMKKPDKILPCPRCNSMDTKFCYYNNYNVNQPRHFCKSCQRYWTAGGTMRNVAVGAGRRKSKCSSSRYCQITVSEALQAARIDVPNGVHHPSFRTNGTVLTFGSDSHSPICELNIPDQNVLNGPTIPCPSNGDGRSSGSTVTTTSPIEDRGVKRGPQEPIKQNLNGFTPQVPFLQWPYVWNPTVPIPAAFCPSAVYPMSFYPAPAPYWNGATPWNIPWVSPCPPTQKNPGSNLVSQTLGKHSREGETLKLSNNNGKCSGTSTVLVPKTLRIDDPIEAAKSSIWTTLGIKKGDSLSKGGFFDGFQSKGNEKDHKIEASPTLIANPAALCRSVSFQENV